MTTLTASAQGTTRRFGGLTGLASKIAAAIRDGRRMMAQYDELTRLPDSELARMGVRREDIPQIVASSR